MKNVIVFILCTCLVNLIDASDPIYSKTGVFYPSVSSRTVIFGKITNINTIQDAPRKIELAVDDITMDHQFSYQTDISDAGEFVFDIPLYHSINTYLIYGDARVTPYLFPNDTVHITCQIAKRGFQYGIASGKFDNKHDRFENAFFSYYRWIHYTQISEFREKLPKELTPQQIKEQYLAFEKELQNRISERVKKDSIGNTIAEYLKRSATYSIYYAIIRAGQQIENNEEKQNFYAFLTDSVVFNKKARVTSDYNSFLNAYRFNVEPRTKFRVELTGKTEEQAHLEMVDKNIQHGFKIRKGIWAEFLAAQHMFELSLREEELSQTTIQSYSEITQKTFTDKYIREMLLAMLDKTSQKVKEIGLQTIPADAQLQKYDSLTGEQLLEKIVDENKGKVIYIDIWATWCSPCKQQIPHAQKLHKMLKNKNVAFVYLCSRSKEETWQNVIKQYQMTGNQIFLNDTQYNFLKSKFSIIGIPRYILIDSLGKIIDDDAPGPDSELIINKINEMIEG